LTTEPSGRAKLRRSARRLALDVLYEAEIRDLLPIEAFDVRELGGWVLAADSEDGVDPDEGPGPDAVAYARSLVEGVQDNQAALDARIAKYADHWAIERMPIVDRSLLRIAIYELTGDTDVPVAVAINEAVELAKSLSTDDSGRFVNGLLGRVVEEEGLRPSEGHP
jgi:transcription antitermination protein NusB